MKKGYLPLIMVIFTIVATIIAALGTGTILGLAGIKEGFWKMFSFGAISGGVSVFIWGMGLSLCVFIAQKIKKKLKKR